MRVRVREIGWIVGALLVAGLLIGPARAQKEEVCPYPKQWKISTAELAAKVTQHKEWLNRGNGGPGRSILCKADLTNAVLTKANLSRADLSKTKLHYAFLEGANLSGADMSGANLGLAFLRGANLSKADLSGAELFGVDLSDANLGEADLSGAKVMATNLSGANLEGADLSGATLFGADLSRANLVQTNFKEVSLFHVTLTDALYEPIAAPAKGSVSRLMGLTTVGFRFERESGLVLLREMLRESGLRDFERQATFAIEHQRTRYALAGYGERAKYDENEVFRRIVEKDVGAQIEGVFKLVFFEWTTDYGLHYGRPLLILVILIPVMAVGFYLGPLVIPQNTGHQHGIYEVLPKGRLVTTEGRDETADDEAVERLTLSPRRALLFALYFSLLSAFRLGWRDLNVGSWLTRLQFTEYDLRGRGSVRLVSGAQSLTSVYLIALWALTYFGRPFE